MSKAKYTAEVLYEVDESTGISTKRTPYDWIEQLPSNLQTATKDLQRRLKDLEKPDAKTRKHRIPILREQAKNVQGAWDDLAKTAREVLANGVKYGISFPTWRNNMWVHPSYVHGKKALTYWYQQTPAFKAWKTKYDARRYRLNKTGVWAQASAYEAFRDAHEELVESYVYRDTYAQCDINRRVSILETKLAAYNRIGHWCFACERPLCEPCAKGGSHQFNKNIEYWILEAQRIARRELGVKIAMGPREDVEENQEMPDLLTAEDREEIAMEEMVRHRPKPMSSPRTEAQLAQIARLKAYEASYQRPRDRGEETIRPWREVEQCGVQRREADQEDEDEEEERDYESSGAY